MRGLILTGALGSGKTTAQNLLVREYGFWTPMTVTTREVSGAESFSLNVALHEFTNGVAGKQYVLPYRFGHHWYAWPTTDFDRLINDQTSRAVLNVRPYTALLFSAFESSLLPVWLWIEQEELETRLAHRGAARDLDTDFRTLRKLLDEEDRSYETLFSHRVRSDASLIQSLLKLLEHN